MFRRLVFENSAALFTIVAFITAASIYLTFAWRALRMKRPQVARFENLPFETATPEALASTSMTTAPTGRNEPIAPTGRDIGAQGSALGTHPLQETGALKERTITHVAPFQGSSSVAIRSQGVALGCHLPLRGDQQSA